MVTRDALEPARAGSTRRVAVAGLGAVGMEVVRHLDRGIPGLELVSVSARDAARAEAKLAELDRPVPVLPLAELSEASDLVVECAPAELLHEVAGPALRRGRLLMVISVGALLSAPELIELARTRGTQIIVPTGALLGLDAVTAAAEGTIHSVRMVTRKPAAGLKGAPHLVQRGIDLDGLREPLLVFEGSAREAAAGFPANLNVAAALSLAGIGPDRTMLQVWADPGVERNVHEIEVESDSARFSMRIENIPTHDNPRTGRITAQSVIAALRKLSSPLRIGT